MKTNGAHLERHDGFRHFSGERQLASLRNAHAMNVVGRFEPAFLGVLAWRVKVIRPNVRDRRRSSALRLLLCRAEAALCASCTRCRWSRHARMNVFCRRGQRLGRSRERFRVDESHWKLFVRRVNARAAGGFGDELARKGLQGKTSGLDLA